MNDNVKRKALVAKTHKELLQAMGMQHFYQIMPVSSLLDPGKILIFHFLFFI